ncbi:MAG: DUF2441 domain-containing protein [Firmicutes bacterium]|nr:DUF2441 domain-containing protein [Bacillota bacterium]
MEELMYHIHKKGYYDNIWKIGSKFEVGLSVNSFTEISLNFESKILIEGVKYPFLNVYNHYKSLRDIQNQLNLLNTANDFINEYQMLIRELGLEEVRQDTFSELPSRKHCIWLCRENQLDYWKEMLHGEFEIFKVKIFEKCFKTRNYFIPLPTDSYNTILQQAVKYWGYSNEVENEDDEYLYIGKLEIIERNVKESKEYVFKRIV